MGLNINFCYMGLVLGTNQQMELELYDMVLGHEYHKIIFIIIIMNLLNLSGKFTATDNVHSNIHM
jgi:hypothetical protein